MAENDTPENANDAPENEVHEDAAVHEDAVHEDEEHRMGAIHRPTGSPALASLTTPCSLAALRTWLQTVQVQASGDEQDAQVTTTTTSISVA